MMMMITAEFATYWTLLDDNLVLLGREGSRLGPALRLYSAGLNASEAACVIAPYQARIDADDRATASVVSSIPVHAGHLLAPAIQQAAE